MVSEMASSNTTVLVLGTEPQSMLIELLFDMGVVPIMRKKMLPALDRIRHEDFDAVFLDHNRGDVDVLEFVLNVRDHNGELPVVVLGGLSNAREHEVLNAMQPVFLVKGIEDLEDQIQHILQLN